MSHFQISMLRNASSWYTIETLSFDDLGVRAFGCNSCSQVVYHSGFEYDSGERQADLESWLSCSSALYLLVKLFGFSVPPFSCLSSEGNTYFIGLYED